VLKLIINYLPSQSNSPTKHNLIQLVAIFSILQLAFVLGWRFYNWCNLKFVPLLENRITQVFFEKVMEHSQQFFQDTMVGSIAKMMYDAAILTPSIITTYISSLLLNGLTIIFATFAFAQISLWLALTMGVLVMIYVGLLFMLFNNYSFLANKVVEVGAKIIGEISDALSNISNIRLFARKKYELAQLTANQKLYIQAARQRGYFLLKFEGIQSLLFASYQIISLLVLIYLYAEEKVTAGDFIMIISINTGLIGSLWNLGLILHANNLSLSMVRQALTLLNYPHDIVDKQCATKLQIKHGKIEFKSVSFGYPGGCQVFNKLSFTIQSKQKVGIVGYSGVGKTTLLNLILRLFEVDSGCIVIDDLNIQEVTQGSLRNNIALIPQDPILFHRSIMDNIRYGKEGSSDAEVIEAAQQAFAHEFITELPQGYASVVGERGIKLSGGQRQRIAIARAFLKNAPILILDEATSNLDSETENLIQQSLIKLMNNKTVIVIAHRLSTLQIMERILVMAHGNIVEDGSHQQLLAANKHYAFLWNSQIDGCLPS
jgi:ATP-binding cassette subfamily B protein